MPKCSVGKKSFRHLCIIIAVDQLFTITDLGRGCSWSCNNCRKNGNQICDLKNPILLLQNDIRSLKAEYSTLKTYSNDFELEEVIAELNERNSCNP